MALRERVAVVVVGVVDSAAGVGGFVPRPSDVVVLVQDGERHTRLLQAMRRQDARHAGTDDHRADVGAGGEGVDLPCGRATILTFVGELLLQ